MKYLLALLLAFPLYAQTFNSEYDSAKSALDALDAAAEQRVAQDISDLASANSTITKQQAQIDDLNSQLAAIQNQHIFEHLEEGIWGINCAAIVGGAGNASGTYASPGIETAQLFLQPAGTYGDCYYSQKFGPHDTLSSFTYDIKFLFPSQLDASASQALELDFKQPISGLMFQFAAQIRFSGNELRYWTPATKWTSFSPIFPIQRFTPGQWYELIVKAHHDTTSEYLDSYTFIVPGQQPKTVGLNVSWLAPQTNWADNLIIAVQLDGNSVGTPYRVKVLDARVTAQ